MALEYITKNDTRLRTNWRRVVLWILLVIGAGFLIASSLQTAARVAIESDGVRTTGTITDLEASTYFPRGGSLGDSQVIYTVNGVEHAALLSWSSNLKVGEEVELAYDAENPSDVVRVGVAGRGEILLTGIGGVLILVSSILLALDYSTSRRRS